MTKRPSPFEPSIFRQTKIHLNNYENDLKALKGVEEKTLKKLIEGSRKSHTIIFNDKDFSNSESDSPHRSNNYLQKCVTDYFIVKGKKLNENGRVLISSFEDSVKCFFCDSNMNSVYQCSECLEFYCPACSFVVYESSEDKRICLSCC